MKHTIGWESNGINSTYYGKSMSKNFPGYPHSMVFVGYYWETISQISPFDGFGCLSPCYGNLMRKHMHFPCDKVCHKMRI